MSQQVLIVGIIAIAVIIVLYLFRDNLKDFSFNATAKGINAKLGTRDPLAGSATHSSGATVENSRARRNIRADASGDPATVRGSDAQEGDIEATSTQVGDPAHPKA